MAEDFRNRLKNAWNVFLGRDPPIEYQNLGMSYAQRPDRPRMSRGTEKTIVTPVLNRIAMDCASVEIKHVKLDEDGRYISTIQSGLNNCLTLSANKDQTGRAFVHDAVLSMFDEGCVALVPVDFSVDPYETNSYDVLSIRVAKIVNWYPNHVKVQIYNDRTGQTVEILRPKDQIAIVENPFYVVMNGDNSILKRLIRLLNNSDSLDNQNASGKLDMIIQLPFSIRSEARKETAENRVKDIQAQLQGSNYGIAYIDSTEHVTQLNRSVENNTNSREERLTKMFYSQLGMTEEIMNGTATPEAMQNYYSRCIEPILSAFADECKRKFLTKTARTQGQSIMFFRDPFKLMPVNLVADIADKFTRNEIMSSNEIRQIVGRKPVDDPKADELRNKNINAQEEQTFAKVENEQTNKETKSKGLRLVS